ncbi:MAG: hypothetical protein V2A72_06650 [Candidatus Omnitrophota bacterium]
MAYKANISKERLLRYIKLSPKKKLEWLRQMHEFTVMASSKRLMAIRWKLRQIN